ncbi:hypothetical protein ACTFIZ_007970 [Dictyostelium cf. discoideum]
MSETEQLQAKDSNRQHYHSLIHQSPGWSDTRTISSVRTTMETIPPKPSFRDESQIVQSNQVLQLVTEERSVQLQFGQIQMDLFASHHNHKTINYSTIRMNALHLGWSQRKQCMAFPHQNFYLLSWRRCTHPTTKTFAFYPGENELVQFNEGFYNTDLSNLEINNMVSNDSSTSSLSSTSHVSSSYRYIQRSNDQKISRVNTNPNSTTLETRDYSTFQCRCYTRFLNFCTLNSLDPSTYTALLNKKQRKDGVLLKHNILPASNH